MSCKTCKRALHSEHEDKDGNCCFCAPENFKEPVKKSWKSDSAPPKPKRKRKDDE